MKANKQESPFEDLNRPRDTTARHTFVTRSGYCFIVEKGVSTLVYDSGLRYKPGVTCGGNDLSGKALIYLDSEDERPRVVDPDRLNSLRIVDPDRLVSFDDFDLESYSDYTVQADPRLLMRLLKRERRGRVATYLPSSTNV